MPSQQRVRANKWYEFIRIFSDGKKENRYIREIIYGVRKEITYWQITTDKQKIPENGSSFVMTNIKGSPTEQKKKIGNLYGQRTWIEYGFRQCKQELGWTDYRLTKAKDILKWWEIINSVYWMISLNTNPLKMLRKKQDKNIKKESKKINFNHEDWQKFDTWKNTLKNYRIMIQPIIIFTIIFPWLKITNNQILQIGFNNLLTCANHYMNHFLSG